MWLPRPYQMPCSERGFLAELDLIARWGLAAVSKRMLGEASGAVSGGGMGSVGGPLYVAPMASDSSLDLLLDINKSEREALLSHFDSLDTKAGLVLGFAGVLIAVAREN